MPLSCDCYGGCWGDHSEDWPGFEIPKSLIDKYRDRYYPQSGAVSEIVDAADLPYGSYVTVTKYRDIGVDDREKYWVLRVETEEMWQRAATLAKLLS